MSTCLLHPLAALNISDHYSRTKAQSKDEAAKAACCVLGCVIGNSRDGVVEIFNSFEIITGEDGCIDMAYLSAKQAHYKNVFHEHDVVGWYAVPQNANHETNHALIARQMQNENIVSLVLDPNTSSSEDLPFSATNQAGRMDVQVVSTDAEKIGIDHIARVVPQGGSASLQLTAHLGGVHGAIGKLSQCIEIICNYLEGVKSGALPKNHSVLRQVQGLCNRLPVQNTQASKETLLQNYNDVMLVTYLASLTKTANEANEVVEKFNTAFEKHRRHHHRPF